MTTYHNWYSKRIEVHLWLHLIDIIFIVSHWLSVYGLRIRNGIWLAVLYLKICIFMFLLLFYLFLYLLVAAHWFVFSLIFRQITMFCLFFCIFLTCACLQTLFFVVCGLFDNIRFPWWTVFWILVYDPIPHLYRLPLHNFSQMKVL